MRAELAMSNLTKAPRGTPRGTPPPPGVFAGGVADGGGGGGDDTSPEFAYQPANRACQLLFGAGIKTAPIDVGFPTHTPFEHGELDVRQGEVCINVEKQQAALSGADRLLGYALIAGAIASGVGLLYLGDKYTLVKEGQVAIVQSYDGRTRALGRGMYLSATVGTSVVKFALSE